jgi:ubiquinone biosynthesis protein
MKRVVMPTRVAINAPVSARTAKLRRKVRKAIWRADAYQEAARQFAADPPIVPVPRAHVPSTAKLIEEVLLDVDASPPPHGAKLPRPDPLETPAIPKTQDVGVLAIFLRLWIWVWAAFLYALGTLGDVIRFRDTIRRRAARLRLTLESLGPTFIKVGQQLSVRSDVLPREFCDELQLLQERVPPIPFSEAEAVITRRTGVPLEETFSEFQRKPLGSASLACVYRATLREGGMDVAVKVMRPGVAKRMVEEVRALGFLAWLIELLGFQRVGMVTSIHKELNVMLTEELDYPREARNAELFRKGAHELKERWFSAPLVYWELLGTEMIVFEFIKGMTVAKVIDIVDKGDREANPEGWAKLDACNIDPDRIAKYLARSLHWELNEAILFHGDPHPANMIVRDGGELVFIDFGSCGKMTSKFRRTWQNFYTDYARSDAGAMVEGVLRLLEPLPPVDVTAFSKDLEHALWDYIHAGRSEHATWKSRSSGMLWMKFADIARKHHVPMSVEAVRLFRATFLYDTSLFKLWRSGSKADPADEYRAYLTDAGKRAKKRVLREVRERAERGLRPEDYLRIEEAVRFGQQTITTLQHLIDLPQAAMGDIIPMMAYFVATGLRIATVAIVGGMGLYGWHLYRHFVQHHTETFAQEVEMVVRMPEVQIVGTILGGLYCLVLLRKLLVRLGEPMQRA